MDELNKTTATGTVTTHTDAGADSARDVHQATYTTTPLDSRVSSSNEGLGGAVGLDMPDPKEVTGQFDHLATRDPEAMENRLQTPEYQGAQTTAAVDTGVLDSLVGGNDLGLTGSAGALGGMAAGTTPGALNPDPNSGYTAPALSGPPHVSEQPGDLPPGETEELKNQIKNR